MTEQVQETQEQTQDEQHLEQAQDFFARSMGRIKGQMQSDGAQLQGFMQQLPPEAQAQLQEMTDPYSQFEGTIDQAVQEAGVADALEESAAQSRQNADQASGQDPTDVAASQAQEMAGDVGDQVQDAIGDLVDSLPEGYEALGQPFTDDQGNQILQAQDDEGNTAIVRRETDGEGETVDSFFDQRGNLLDENLAPVLAEEEPEDMASQMAQSLPEGFEVAGDPTTDEEGNTILEGRDDEGNVVDSTFDPEGNLLDETIVPDLQYRRTTGSLSFTPRKLSSGSHTVEITAGSAQGRKGAKKDFSCAVS